MANLLETEKLDDLNWIYEENMPKTNGWCKKCKRNFDTFYLCVKISPYIGSEIGKKELQQKQNNNLSSSTKTFR